MCVILYIYVCLFSRWFISNYGGMMWGNPSHARNSGSFWQQGVLPEIEDNRLKSFSTQTCRFLWYRLLSAVARLFFNMFHQTLAHCLIIKAWELFFFNEDEWRLARGALRSSTCSTSLFVTHPRLGGIPLGSFCRLWYSANRMRWGLSHAGRIWCPTTRASALWLGAVLGSFRSSDLGTETKGGDAWKLRIEIVLDAFHFFPVNII